VDTRETIASKKVRCVLGGISGEFLSVVIGRRSFAAAAHDGRASERRAVGRHPGGARGVNPDLRNIDCAQVAPRLESCRERLRLRVTHDARDLGP
jgi:hypothetical protein